MISPYAVVINQSNIKSTGNNISVAVDDASSSRRQLGTYTRRGDDQSLYLDTSGEDALDEDASDEDALDDTDSNAGNADEDESDSEYLPPAKPKPKRKRKQCPHPKVAAAPARKKRKTPEELLRCSALRYNDMVKRRMLKLPSGCTAEAKIDSFYQGESKVNMWNVALDDEKIREAFGAEDWAFFKEKGKFEIPFTDSVARLIDTFSTAISIQHLAALLNETPFMPSETNYYPGSEHEATLWIKSVFAKLLYSLSHKSLVRELTLL